MKTLITAIGTVLLGFGGMIIASGCADETTNGSSEPIQQMAEAVAESVISNAAEAELASAIGVEPAVDSSAQANQPSVDDGIPAISFDPDPTVEAMLVVGTNLFAASGEGLIVYDFANRSHFTIATESTVHAIAVHSGRVYVGADQLFTYDDSVLTPVDFELPAPVTALESFSYRLFIGTEAGLHATSIFGQETLLEDYPISALAATESGVWVGTKGVGLFQFDGVDFRERYLARDPSLMKQVTALDSKGDYVYIGTDNGLFVHDGGRWQQLGVEDGLPSNSITAIDASYWVVSIGTTDGLTTYFDGDITPVTQLATTPITSVARYGSKIIVGSTEDRLLVKSGPVVRPIIPPANPAMKKLLSVLR